MASHPIQRWLPLIEDTAREVGVAPRILAGLVMQESSGDPWAIRVERGFWGRYLDGILAFVKRSPSKVDDRWAEYPDIYSASYGLCQVMLQTALEHGWTMRRFPTELLDPAVNLRVAAEILRKHIAKGLEQVRQGKAGDAVHVALLRYNGGGDPEYPARVLAHARALEREGVLSC